MATNTAGSEPTRADADSMLAFVDDAPDTPPAREPARAPAPREPAARRPAPAPAARRAPAPAHVAAEPDLIGEDEDYPDDAPADEDAAPDDAALEDAELVEGDEDAAPEGDDAADPDGDGPLTADTLVTVVVNGTEERVTLAEALKGYARERDYTQKTMALGRERQEVQQVREQADQTLATYGQRLEQLESVLKENAAQEPDWNELRRTMEPADFAAAVADYQLQQERITRLQRERERVQGELTTRQQQEYARYLAEQQRKLVDMVPEWKDETKFREGSRQLGEYAISIGFTPEEINAVADARVVNLLRKGMLYDKMKNDLALRRGKEPPRGPAPRGARPADAAPAARPAPAAAPAPGTAATRAPTPPGRLPTVRPGAATVTPPQSSASKVRATQALDRLKKTGTTEDAARYFMATDL